MHYQAFIFIFTYLLTQVFHILKTLEFRSLYSVVFILLTSIPKFSFKRTSLLTNRNGQQSNEPIIETACKKETKLACYTYTKRRLQECRYLKYQKWVCKTIPTFFSLTKSKKNTIIDSSYVIAGFICNSKNFLFISVGMCCRFRMWSLSFLFLQAMC